MAILDLSLTKSSATGQDLDQIIASVREYLQDEATPYRYSDADIVEGYNDFLLEVRRVRPDYYIGTYADALPVATAADVGQSLAFPLSADIFDAAKLYVAGIISVRDDQYAQDGRAVNFMNRAMAIVGGR